MKAPTLHRVRFAFRFRDTAGRGARLDVWPTRDELARMVERIEQRKARAARREG